MAQKDLLLIGNGHGEDTILCRVLDRLNADGGPPLTVDAWAMVGEGDAFARRGVALVGAPNLLPGGGFGTLDAKSFQRDLRAGFLPTYWRQARAARALAGRYRLILAAGDIVPLAAGALARTPMLFIGCAKSAYYRPPYAYNGLEKALMRRFAAAVFPRDALTAKALAAQGVAVIDAGNPMMDGLEARHDDLGLPQNAVAVAMLAGTRADAEANAADLLAAAAAVAPASIDASRLWFVFAAHDGLDHDAVWRASDGWARLPDVNPARMTLAAPGGAHALFVKQRFNETLAAATLAIGMAGTANEQAVGLGLPLVATPSAGVQGEAFVRMKAQFFGQSAITAARGSRAIAAAIEALLGDADRRARMGAEGRVRMGPPGASAAIAAEVRLRLDGNAA